MSLIKGSLSLPGQRQPSGAECPIEPGEKLKKIAAKSGASIATIAAALLLSGAVLTATSVKAEDAKGHCMGANACKGTSACKTASNACKGQNACKGTGFTATTAEECAKVKDAKFEPAK